MIFKNNKKKYLNTKIRRTNSAFTIVETLVTLLAITIMISAPLLFMVRSYNYSQFITAKIVATGLSQEGIELATSLRNKELSTFMNYANNCSSGCYIDWNGVSDTPTITPCTGEGCRLLANSLDTSTYFRHTGDKSTDFYRYLTFTPNGGQSFTVESVVYTYVESVKVEVKLKKIISNITIK